MNAKPLIITPEPAVTAAPSWRLRPFAPTARSTATSLKCASKYGRSCGFPAPACYSTTLPALSPTLSTASEVKLHIKLSGLSLGPASEVFYCILKIQSRKIYALIRHPHPHLGQSSVAPHVIRDCSQLDFLPLRCLICIEKPLLCRYTCPASCQLKAITWL